MRHRTFTWLALGAIVIAGNTALVVWLQGRPGGRTRVPPREARAARRPPTAEESALPASAGPTVRVAVFDAGGAPVPSASVRAVAERRAFASPFREPPLAEGRTGDDGVLELALPRPARARLLVAKEGFAPGDVPARPEVRVVLQREGVVRVRVREAMGGGPVPDAVVLCRRDREPAVAGEPAGDGDFLVRGLPAGPYEVEVTSALHPPAASTVEVAPGAEAVVEVRLGRGVALRGRVVFAGTDRVASSGTVSAEGRSAALGEDGRFVLRGLAAPVREFRIETGGVVYRATGQRVALDPVTGEQAGEILVPIPGNNPAGLQYQGSVRDEEGRPVAGARVMVDTRTLERLPMVERGYGDAWHRECFTDEGGRYRITAEHAGNEILVLHPGYAPTFFLLPPRSRSRAFDLVMVRGARLLVVVRDAAGRPATGASVYTFMRHPDPALASGAYADVLESLRSNPATDGSGRAVLPGLGPGSWYLCSRSADGREGARVVLDVEKGEEEIAVDLALRPLPSARGRVVDVTGRPLAGVSVSCPGENPPHDFLHAVTDATGRFRFDGIVLAPAEDALAGVPLQVGTTRRVVGADGKGVLLVPLDRETEIVVE